MMTRRAALRTAVCAGMMAACVLCTDRVLLAADTGSTDVCVTLNNSNGRVSGLQLDLTWDPSCMSAQTAEGDAAACSSNPSTRKNVQTKLFANTPTMRALFLSVSDTSPVQDDELFCCRFTVAQSGSCCSLSVSNLILAGRQPTGGIGRVYDADILVQTTVGGISCVASPAGGSPDNPVRPVVPPAAIAPPAVYAPEAIPGRQAAPPAAPQQPAAPRANMPAGAPVAGGPAAAPAPELAPAESPTARGGVTGAGPTATRPKTAVAARTATVPARTPQVQPTPTGPGPSATQPATTPTPKHKAQKKKHGAGSVQPPTL